MCGIAGVVMLDPQREPHPEGLTRMADVLRHRGPDDQGFHSSGSAGLVHRRLSIIDLAAGHQPMGVEAPPLWVVFNGEIYNFQELRKDLESRGHDFHTRSDTEVLLHLYQEYGVECFGRLNGMFACGFWDPDARSLLLVRDRFGKKPLFYYQDQERFLFASEMKAILAYGDVPRDIEWPAMGEFLTYSYIAGSATIYRHIHRLGPGQYLILNNGRVTIRPYYEFQYDIGMPPPSEADAAARLEILLQEAVERRMISDVPLGAFLSGGIDSSTIVALMARASGRPVRTFTVGFDEPGYSEIADARVASRHIGTDHHEIVVKPAAIDLLADLAWHFDEPFGDSSAIPTYYVCQGARTGVTVALSGDGGDEVFAGYSRYLELSRYQRIARCPRILRRLLAGPGAALVPHGVPGYNTLYALAHYDEARRPGSLGLFPFIRDRLFAPEFARLTRIEADETERETLATAAALDPITRRQYLDMIYYLPPDILVKVDRMSMAHSLEVRSPFLDPEVVGFMATLPAAYKLRGNVTKRLLRRVAENILPAEILTKRKQGFGLPKGPWFQRELRSFAKDLLLDPRTLARGYVRPREIQRILRDHSDGRRDYSTWIWCLLVLETWHRVFLDSDTRRV